MITPKQLAEEFDRVLRNDVTPKQYDEILRLNRTEAYSEGTCATHDFCDSNMTMLEAVQNLGVDEDDNRLWNDAWNEWRQMTA
jgi:hypothetical protein